VPPGVHTGKRSERELDARGGGERRELEPVRARGVERLGDRDRPVPEEGVGRQQLDVHQIAGQMAQGEHRFQARHAPAGDEHPQAVVADRSSRSFCHRGRAPPPIVRVRAA
jgi:hypothetical protein